MSGVSGASGVAGDAGLGTSGDPLPSKDALGWRRRLTKAMLRDGMVQIIKTLCPDDALRSLRLCGIGGIITPDGPTLVEARQCPDTGHVAITGTVSCSNARVCPTCAPRIARTRREEIRGYCERADEAGMRRVFATFTLRHTPDQGPRQQLAAVQAASSAIWSGRQVGKRRELGLIAAIRAIETTLLGKAGPHTHVHMMVFFEAGTGDETIESIMLWMAGVWKQHAERHMDGLRPSDAHGCQWEIVEQGGAAAGDYLAKLVECDDDWTAADEMTRSDLKRGRGGSVSPMQLLALAVTAMREDGDMWFAEQWVRYVRETQGTRPLFVAPKVKAALPPPELELTDEQIVAEAVPLDGWVQIAAFLPQTWDAIVRRHGLAATLDILQRRGELAAPILLRGIRCGEPPPGQELRAG